jgi:hypothetical protein
MIKRRSRSRFGRRGRESAFMLGEGVRVERVLPRQVLPVNKSLGAGDPHSKLRRGFPCFALAIIGMARRSQISLAQFGALRPVASRNARPEPDAVSAGRGAEYAREMPASKTGERIVVGALLERGDCTYGGGEQRDLARKDVTEQAGNAQSHIDPRPAQHRQRHDLEPVDAGRRGVPGRPAADQRERLPEIIAAGAHGRGSP